MRFRILLLFMSGMAAATLFFMGAGVSVSGTLEAYQRDPMEVWFGYAVSACLVFILSGILGDSIARHGQRGAIDFPISNRKNTPV